MKSILGLFFIIMLFFTQTAYSEGQSQQPWPPSSQQTQSVSGGNAWTATDNSQQNSNFQDEYYLGRAVAANILNTYKPYTANQELTSYLNRICQAIVINSSQPVIFNGYHVLVLDTPEFNAFATPGGHIFITKGLLEASASEDMLAALIAHELAHIMLKHGMKLIDDMDIFNQAAQAASMGQALSGNASANRLMQYRNSVASMIDTMIKNGYSQTQEFEADREAVKLLAAAGYDPASLVEMLRVLQRVQTSQKGGFNNTHPSPAMRITNAETYVRSFKVQDTKSYRVPRFKNK